MSIHDQIRENMCPFTDEKGNCIPNCMHQNACVVAGTALGMLQIYNNQHEEPLGPITSKLWYAIRDDMKTWENPVGVTNV
jgi:hypothetical protein